MKLGRFQEPIECFKDTHRHFIAYGLCFSAFGGKKSSRVLMRTFFADVFLRHGLIGRRLEQQLRCHKGDGRRRDGVQPKRPQPGPRGQSVEVQGEEEEEEVREANPIRLSKGLRRDEAEDKRAVRQDAGDEPAGS